MQEMRPVARCPACASEQVVKGSVVASDADERFDGAFYPEGLKFMAIRRSVAVLDKQGFLACANCGCRWNFVDASQLRQLMRNLRTGESVFAPGVSHGARWTLLLMLVAVLLTAIMSVIRH